MSIYLDNAATSFPKPEQVYQAVEQAMRHLGVGPGRGGYTRAIEANRLVLQARESLAEFIGAPDSSRIVFAHSATEALNLAVQGLVGPGDHVVTTTMEHNSLARPLHLMASRGAEVTWVEADREGFVTPRQIAGALRPTTRLVALSHCSNVTGTVQPVAEIGEITRKAGVLLLVDAAQSAGHLPLNMLDMNIDLLAAPGHKGLLGPQGTGFLAMGSAIDIHPLLVGGTGSSSASLEQPTALPERLESGTPNTPGIAGLLAGVEYIQAQGLEYLATREQKLVAQLLEGLALLPGVAIHGPADLRHRAGVVSFSVAGLDPSAIGFRLNNEYDICVRTGLHCAPCAHRTIGTFPLGNVRVSPGTFSSAEDIDLLLRAMHGIIR